MLFFFSSEKQGWLPVVTATLILYKLCCVMRMAQDLGFTVP